MEVVNEVEASGSNSQRAVKEALETRGLMVKEDRQLGELAAAIQAYLLPGGGVAAHDNVLTAFRTMVCSAPASLPASDEIDLENPADRKALATTIQDGAWAAAQRAMQDETVEILLRYGLVTASDEALSQMVSAIRHEDDAALDSIIKTEVTPKDGPANNGGMTP
jgi:hypothetical protein